jgi:hypothetical protein
MNEPVKINKIEDTTAHLFLNKVLIGLIETELQLHDVRLQIARQKLDGYYIFFDVDGITHKISIKPDGSLSHWPTGFFDTQQKILAEIVRMKKVCND